MRRLPMALLPLMPSPVKLSFMQNKILRTLNLSLVLLALASMIIGPLYWPAQAQDDPTPTPDRQEIQTVGIYEKFEVTIEIPGEITNPYDWGEVQVWGNFTARSGQGYQVPAFYIQPYEQTCQEDCQLEILAPIVQGEWH